jgi:cephalosporin-C deacetylase-like acetyl esterase
MKTTLALLASLLLASLAPLYADPSPLPNTLPLQPNPDFSGTMVAGIDQFLLRQTEQAKAARAAQWPGDAAVHREHLKTIIGAVDKRLPCTALEFVGSTSAPALLAETDNARIFRVRWPVLDGVNGEGILIQPKSKPLARVIYIPDADTVPEKLANDAMLAYSGCEIVIPALISRGSEFSNSERFGVKTNAPHREWIYRQSFIQGRHIIGFEVQKIMALMDYFSAQKEQAPTLVAGLGEGGLIAMYSGALDPRIGSVYVWGYFGPREGLWSEPIYRNLNGLLREFGDAEIASLIAPRHLVVHHLGFPNVQGPPAAKPGQRAIAAPGKISMPPLADVQAEVSRAQTIAPGDWIKLCTENDGLKEVVAHLLPKEIADQIVNRITPIMPEKNAQRVPIDGTRQERMVRELERFAQGLLVDGEATRTKEFWKPAPLAPLDAFQDFTAKQREHLWKDVIGRLPDPNVPMNARSRFVKETDKVRIYEVTLDVWDGVFAWGWLALPKDLKDGEKRPVVVCQHGLEGVPEDVFDTNETGKSWKYYKAFALRLAEEGYITFAPHNPYRGHDAFRTLQRKANPLGLSLFSVIIGQHQRILEWLKAQPFTDSRHIAFYGLSYGGKSAMRIPAVLTDYCLSICSGDFNEWVRKCADTTMPMCYVFTPEYEIWEWDLSHTFNYAEMAALIAPRPFMVERGHNDGVGMDEWVDYEFAKVRRLYDKLGVGGRASIEHFEGPHTINGKGTFELLRKECPIARGN